MINVVGFFVLLLFCVAILTLCVCVWLMLFARMWRDLRFGRGYELCGTVWAVLVFGAVAALCGIGAYTVAQATVLALFDVIPWEYR